MLLRSAEINGISTSGRQLLVTQLHGTPGTDRGIIIDLRTSGTSDPDFPYVTEKRIRIPGHSQRYDLFVTGSAERSGISKALQAIADSPKESPIWVHCRLGRDRTGIIVALIMVILGAEDENSNFGDVEKEYLRTGGAKADRLYLFFDTIAERYGIEDGYPDDSRNGVINYLKSIRVTDEDIDHIRDKFTLAS